MKNPAPALKKLTLVAHGRAPFSGSRRVLVGMAGSSTAASAARHEVLP